MTASVHSEKTHLKKIIMIIIISMNKSQERAPKIDFRYELKDRKEMVDF